VFHQLGNASDPRCNDRDAKRQRLHQDDRQPFHKAGENQYVAPRDRLQRFRFRKSAKKVDTVREAERVALAFKVGTKRSIADDREV